MSVQSQLLVPLHVAYIKALGDVSLAQPLKAEADTLAEQG
jgi:hypothetical protein